jgi:hypothetical protein
MNAGTGLVLRFPANNLGLMANVNSEGAPRNFDATNGEKPGERAGRSKYLIVMKREDQRSDAGSASVHFVTLVPRKTTGGADHACRVPDSKKPSPGLGGRW